MLDGQVDHATADILPPAPRADDRRQIGRDEHGSFALSVEIWRAPLHLGFAFGLFMATRALGVR
jgi:hypothetical protein